MFASLYKSERINMKNIISLSTTEKIDLEAVGQKAYNLILLKANSIMVPDGFVLSTSGLKAYQSDFELMKNEIRSLLKNLNSSYLMVRSSAVGEDSSDCSFAGQLDSFKIENDLELVLDAVRKCWGSLNNVRLKQYQKANNKTLKSMGVIIQEMISPAYAGVLFTLSTNDINSMSIEYVEGHAEKLVQGQVTPKSIDIPTQDNLIPFPVNDLVLIGKDILKIFDQVPQDIEWAYDTEFYIVQTRPITSFQNKTIFWSSTNVNENYPNKLSPLLNSIARRSYYHYFKNLCLQLKIIKEGEGEELFNNIIGLWGQRMYYNMNSIRSIIALTPLSSSLQKYFDDFVGYQTDHNLSVKKTPFFKKLRFSLNCLWQLKKLSKNVSIIESKVSSYANQAINQNSCFTLYHNFLQIRFNDWHRAAYADFFSMIFHGILGKITASIFAEEHQGIQNKLIQAIPNLVSKQPILELWKIKQQIEKDHHIDDFINLTSEELLHELYNNAKFNGCKRIIDNYLDQWGFRCTGELTFFGENYTENPLSFLNMLKNYLNSDQKEPAALFASKQDEQRIILKETCKEIFQKYSIFKALPMTIFMRGIIRLTTFSISCRERVRLKQAQMYFKFKQVLQFIGKDLKNKNALDGSHDIFYLEYDEISRLLAGEHLDTEYLKNLISLRKNKLIQSKEFPENIKSIQFDYSNYVFNQDRKPQNGKVQKGLAACGGVVKARAVVIDSIHEIDQLQQGDILVTKQTDPGWICAFPLISGLIVERGGMLSHGAIVAREFGIPAVVGIKDITYKIKTNDVVLLDGYQGLVECLES
ncbi:MAG: hypothetical protein COA79_20695 [Planctomycetota bacterium]|nr:MAG: hypothetical protein COA79_20695 [Planctomycetota bacterium]